MILTRIDPVQAGIERFTTRRMRAERLTSTHYPEIRRLHLHPQSFMPLRGTRYDENGVELW